MRQQWHCIVLGVDAECVECECHDMTNPNNPVEVKEIYLRHFDPADVPRLTEGMTFTWTIAGHEYTLPPKP